MFKFGSNLKTRVSKKQEDKYSFPCLTIYPAPKEGNKVFKFSFNKAAIEALDIKPNDHLEKAFFDGEMNKLDAPVIANLKENGSIRLNKDGSFSNKLLHQELTEFFNLDSSVENELAITQITESDVICGELGRIEDGVQETIDFEDTTDQQEADLAVKDLDVEGFGIDIPEDLQGYIASDFDEDLFPDVMENYK